MEHSISKANSNRYQQLKPAVLYGVKAIISLTHRAWMASMTFESPLQRACEDRGCCHWQPAVVGSYRRIVSDIFKWLIDSGDTAHRLYQQREGGLRHRRSPWSWGRADLLRQFRVWRLSFVSFKLRPCWLSPGAGIIRTPGRH